MCGFLCLYVVLFRYDLLYATMRGRLLKLLEKDISL